ncbi:MAG: protein kinase [Candidatus Coatesbacteria bacterium]|nr:protein kinase [Candidatus Coatesbacteria bacterium]
MKCPNCGSVNNDDARFCFRCGQSLPEKTQAIQSDEHEQEWVSKAFGGKYQIIRELGRGGMAIVYEAFDIMLDRKVAVKILPKQFAFDEEFVKRFEKEAKIAAQLDHPNIVKIFDIGRQSEIHYFVMNYLPGDTLKRRIHEKGFLDLSEIKSTSLQMCKALQYAHNKGIIHRDLKPSNIMYDHHGNIVLMDFGIAYAAFGTKITSTGTQMGTPHYMSPEQASGEKVDHRADLYSLGIILYEMATGQVPFQADSSLAVLHKQIYEKPQNPAEIKPDNPSWLTRIILTCLEKDKELRYQSADEILNEFELTGVVQVKEEKQIEESRIKDEPDVKDHIEPVVDKTVTSSKADANKTAPSVPSVTSEEISPLSTEDASNKPVAKDEKKETYSKQALKEIDEEKQKEAVPDDKKEVVESKKAGNLALKIIVGLAIIFIIPIAFVIVYAFATGILYFE